MLTRNRTVQTMQARSEAGVPAFFTAILQALQFDRPEVQSLQTLPSADWHELLLFGDLAHLTLPLMRLCGAAAPEWVRARTEQNRADNTLRVQQIQKTYLEMSAAFAHAGIDHVVLKGFSCHPDFAGALEDRMQSDIDLYLPEQFIPAALQALNDLGYEGNRTLAGYPADHVPEMTRRRGWTWDGNMYDPAMPPAVDLHFCLWNQLRTYMPLPEVEQFWIRRVQRHHGHFSFPALCSIDNLAFSALHILRDVQQGDWVLHHVYELAWLLHTRAEDEKFWQSWATTHSDSLRSLQAISFWLARDWFGCCCAEAVVSEVARLPHPVKQWLLRFSQSPLTGMFRPNKHGVWLHLALLPSPRDKFMALRGTLLPVRLPPMGAPGQDASKTRRKRTFWPSQRHARYLLHVLFRAAFHLQTTAVTLWHGACWWLQQRQLVKSL